MKSNNVLSSISIFACSLRVQLFIIHVHINNQTETPRNLYLSLLVDRHMVERAAVNMIRSNLQVVVLIIM